MSPCFRCPVVVGYSTVRTTSSSTGCAAVLVVVVVCVVAVFNFYMANASFPFLINHFVVMAARIKLVLHMAECIP